MAIQTIQNIKAEAKAQLAELGLKYMTALGGYLKTNAEPKKSELLQQADKLRPHIDTLIKISNIP